jgi:hypothetical protein
MKLARRVAEVVKLVYKYAKISGDECSSPLDKRRLLPRIRSVYIAVSGEVFDTQL